MASVASSSSSAPQPPPETASSSSSIGESSASAATTSSSPLASSSTSTSSRLSWPAWLVGNRNQNQNQNATVGATTTPVVAAPPRAGGVTQQHPAGPGPGVTPSSTNSASNSASSSSRHRSVTQAQTDRHIVEARAALEATMANIYDRELLPRGQLLHANHRVLQKQQADVRAATEALRQGNDELSKVVADFEGKFKEIGMVQNWAEMLARRFMTVEETLRLAGEKEERRRRRRGGCGDDRCEDVGCNGGEEKDNDDDHSICSWCSCSNCCEGTWRGSGSGSGSGSRSGSEVGDDESGGGSSGDRELGEERVVDHGKGKGLELAGPSAASGTYSETDVDGDVRMGEEDTVPSVAPAAGAVHADAPPVIAAVPAVVKNDEVPEDSLVASSAAEVDPCLVPLPITTHEACWSSQKRA